MGRAKAIKIRWIKGLFSLGMGPAVVFGGTAIDAAWGQGRVLIQTAQAEAPTPVIPPSNPVLLGPGANSPGVNLLQQQLTQLGFYSGPIDGNYNTATQEAVKAFQASAGLTMTGWLDNNTWERMSTPKLLSAATPTPTQTEVPALITSSAPVQPSAVTPPPADPSGETPPAQSPTPDATDPVTDTETSPRRRFRRFLALPLAGIALVGIGWGIKRLGRGTSAGQEIPDPAVSGTVLAPVDGDVYGGGRAENDHVAHDSALEAILDLASDYPSPDQTNLDQVAPEDFHGANSGDLADRPTDSLSLAVSQRAAGNLSASQPEVARLSPVNIVSTLVGELSSTDAAVRRRAIWELGQRGNSTAIQPLVNGLMVADSQEKSLIFAALAEIGNRSLQPIQRAWVLGLQDSSPEVRKNAIRDLSRLHDALGQVRPLLIHATQDPDPEVQSTAQWALGQWDRAIPPSLGPSAAERPYPKDSLHP